jgi:hypothetical protein
MSALDFLTIMMTRRRTRNGVVLATVVVWSVGTILYAYQWVISALADPGIAPYENNVIFPLSAFVVFRGVYLLVVGFLIILLELILFKVLGRGNRESGRLS